MRDIIGFILPPIIDLINTRVANTQIRFWISMAVCVVFAFAANIEEFASLDWNTILGKIGLVFTESQIIYKVYWEKSTAREKIYPNRLQ